MRTTLTIDDRLLQSLKEEALRRGVSLKETVNRALRAGLRELQRPTPGEPYRCPTFSMGDPTGISLDKALRVAADLEDEEIARELALRE